MNQFSQILDPFFQFYQNEREFNNKIKIKVNIPSAGT